MTELNNELRSLHGYKAQDAIERLLIFSLDHGYIADYQKGFSIGREGYENDKQFYAPFIVHHHDGIKWIIYSTTSLRTDRVKQNQWDSFNIKEILPSVKKALLIYPDGLPDASKRLFRIQNRRYKNHSDYSFIDEVITQWELKDMLEQYYLQNTTTGQRTDLRGRNYESHIASLLSDESNITKWSTGDVTEEGLYYDDFLKIVNCIGLNPNNIYSIKATSDKTEIGILPSGGNPKTDVLIKCTDFEGLVSYCTISCKRSSNRMVSVHQYSADAFADVLDPTNEQLRSLLNQFQAAGSVRGMGLEAAQQLEALLSPHIEKLTLWALGGINGLGDPITQWAYNILIYSDSEKTMSIYSLRDYARHIISKPPLTFGTPFSWTYQGQRGTNIQLKCRII